MYKPLPDYLTIKKSTIAGLGLHTVKPIKQGTYIGMTHISYNKAEHGVVRTPLGGFGNHSDTPNCFKVHKMEGVTSTWWIVAERDIKADEEITWKYTFYNPNEEENMTLDLNDIITARKTPNEEERHLNMTVKVLKEQVEIFTSRLEPHDTGHLHTAISVLTHRIGELENGGG